MKQLLVIFLSVFIAEVGDKTQLATMLFATDASVSKTGVFLAAAAALVLSSLLAVLAGGAVARLVPESTLKIVAGAAFVLVGIWTLATAYR
ncbi:MAG TPA: TMEM165/GDT1 family protein [Terriglobia bacterium]|nr:TMEM165/GDT1 family protein [Terriglobia bacterium]